MAKAVRGSVPGMFEDGQEGLCGQKSGRRGTGEGIQEVKKPSDEETHQLF